MFSGEVNIAVFATFHGAHEVWIGARREFKPCRGDWQRDMWWYRRQKRQETAMRWQRNGKVGGKNGTV
jgi:hypothetical protein